MRLPTLGRRIESQCVSSLRPYPGNARTHSPKQIKQIARSIQEFGFTNPLLVDDDLQVIAGHGRLLAAKKLGIAEVPVVRLSHLTPAQKRAYVLADNKLALKAGWDPDLLAIELQGLADISLDLELTGFELGEIDLVLSDAAEKAFDRGTAEDSVPNAGAAPPTSRPGDV
jgi:ParB-like chromosome segregation protein Spo0J